MLARCAGLASGRFLYTLQLPLFLWIVGDVPTIHSTPHPVRQLISLRVFLE